MSEDSWVTIERTFNAPIELVWKMWTDPEAFRQWYGPNGMAVPVAEIDLKVGGVRKICMEMQNSERSMKMWFTGVFKEIDAPNRLVYTESMCDENGTIIPAKSMGMPEGTPDITEVTVELVEADGKTQMRMVHAGVREGTAGDGGWRQAFDKLASALGAMDI